MMFEILGFTTIEGTIWNSVAYVSLIAIMFGVAYERFRAQIFVFAPLSLLFYSGFFLGDPLFTVGQSLITTSGVLGLCRVRPFAGMVTMVCLLAIASVSLLLMGVFESTMAILGFYGLMGIVFGILLIPAPKAFLLLSVGTMLLITYAFSVGAWVFFTINFVMLIVNMRGYINAVKETSVVHEKNKI